MGPPGPKPLYDVSVNPMSWSSEEDENDHKQLKNDQNETHIDPKETKKTIKRGKSITINTMASFAVILCLFLSGGLHWRGGSTMFLFLV